MTTSTTTTTELPTSNPIPPQPSKQKETPKDESAKNPDVVLKYKSAAEIAQSTLDQLKLQCQSGKRIIDLCKLGDSIALDKLKAVFKGKSVGSKGLAFPTTINPNHIADNLCPSETDKEAEMALEAGQIVKLALGVHIDGYAVIVADTIFISGDEAQQKSITERQQSAMRAAYETAEFLIRSIASSSSGDKQTTTSIASRASKIADLYGCKALLDSTSFMQERNVLEHDSKQIVLNISDQRKKTAPIVEPSTFEVGEVYTVNSQVTTGPDGKTRPNGIETRIYRVTDKQYMLKLGVSKKSYSTLKQHTGLFPISLRNLGDDEKTVRIGLRECISHELVCPYIVHADRPGEFIAQYAATIAITPNGPLVLTRYSNLDETSLLKDVPSKLDDELKAIVYSPLPTCSKKKKKKAAK